MPIPSKRIIVDGVDYEQLFLFPRILQTVTGALQPPRMIIGLLMVCAIAAFGKGWDKIFEPTIAPQGIIEGGPVTDAHWEVSDITLRTFLTDIDFVPPDMRPEGTPDSWSRINPIEALEILERGYKTTRNVDAADLAERDAAYRQNRRTINDLRPKAPYEAFVSEVELAFKQIIRGTVMAHPAWVTDGAAKLIYLIPKLIISYDPVFTVTFAVFLMLVMAIGGGALSRMTACQIAGQERLGIRDAFSYSVANWKRFCLALLLPPILMLMIGGVMAILGLPMLVPALDIFGGIIYAVAILLGFLVALLAVGYVAGLPLLIPAVACENCDAADAMQRAFAYVVNRPVHLMGYGIVAWLGGVFGFVVISFFAMVVLNVTSMGFGLFNEHSALAITGRASVLNLDPFRPGEIHTWHGGIASFFIDIWQTIILSLVSGYVISYLYSSSTMIYLLVRRAADGQDIEEIWRPGLVPGTLTPMPEPVVEEFNHIHGAVARDDDDTSADENQDQQSSDEG